MTVVASEALSPSAKPSSPWVEFLRYFLCSAAAFGIDVSLYWVALRLGMPYQLAAVAGFVGGVSAAYVLSVRWAFRRRSLDNAAAEFLIFLAIGVAGLGVTEALLWLQVSVLGLPRMQAKLVAAVGVFVFNFSARKIVLFSQNNLRASKPVGPVADDGVRVA
jgi:putative flippase GtrA